MLVDGLDTASAAFEVGYESASQFNREYSRLFGQPPMRDIRTFARQALRRLSRSLIVTFLDRAANRLSIAAAGRTRIARSGRESHNEDVWHTGSQFAL